MIVTPRWVRKRSMVIFYLVDVEAGMVRLVPYGGGRRIAFSANPVYLRFSLRALDVEVPRGLFRDMVMLRVSEQSAGAMTNDVGNSRGQGTLIAMRAGWNSDNSTAVRNEIIIKRVNSIAQSRTFYDTGLPFLIRPGEMAFRNGDYCGGAAWGVPLGGVFLIPSGDMGDNNYSGMGNVPSGNEETFGSGTTNLTDSIPSAKFVVRERFGWESEIVLKVGR